MKKIIYPGTFDPIHNGHIDIATRASKLFDELEFVVAVNAEKTPLFSIEKRLELIQDSVKHLVRGNCIAVQRAGLNFVSDSLKLLDFFQQTQRNQRLY